MNHKLEKLPHSRIRLTITVPGETVQKFYNAAVTKVGQHLEIAGFRKGHAPQQMVIDRVGNQSLLTEMIDLLVPETYYSVLKELKDYYPVEDPKIDVKQLKDVSQAVLVPTEVTYTAEVDIMPAVEVGEYKKIRVKPAKAEDKISDKEIQTTVDELKKVYGDEYLKVGNFKDEAALRLGVIDNLKQQKVLQAESDTYDAIIEAVIKRAKVEVPEAFIHNEIHRMERQIEAQAKVYNMTFDDWLKSEKKTHDDIHKAWRPQAEKAAKVGLILGKIAEAEGIDPSKNNASRLVLDKLREYAIK